jgi:hypothetical protein
MQEPKDQPRKVGRGQPREIKGEIQHGGRRTGIAGFFGYSRRLDWLPAIN